MEAGSGHPVASKDSVWLYKDEDRKDKVHQEFNLLRDSKGNKEGFHGYTSNERKTRKNADLLLNVSGNLVKRTQVRPSKLMPSLLLLLRFASQALDTSEKVWCKT